MVIARELTRALREAGHEAQIIVTPQNRFGHQASAYLATWLTDVTSSEGRPIDQVISLRYPSYAIRHQRHSVAIPNLTAHGGNAHRCFRTSPNLFGPFRSVRDLDVPEFAQEAGYSGQEEQGEKLQTPAGIRALVVHS